jgi:hypothetical protein
MNMMANDAGWRCSERLRLTVAWAQERVLAARPAMVAPRRVAVGRR